MSKRNEKQQGKGGPFVLNYMKQVLQQRNSEFKHALDILVQYIILASFILGSQLTNSGEVARSFRCSCRVVLFFQAVMEILLMDNILHHLATTGSPFGIHTGFHTVTHGHESYSQSNLEYDGDGLSCPGASSTALDLSR